MRCCDRALRVLAVAVLSLMLSACQPFVRPDSTPPSGVAGMQGARLHVTRVFADQTRPVVDGDYVILRGNSPSTLRGGQPGHSTLSLGPGNRFVETFTEPNGSTTLTTGVYRLGGDSRLFLFAFGLGSPLHAQLDPSDFHALPVLRQ